MAGHRCAPHSPVTDGVQVARGWLAVGLACRAASPTWTSGTQPGHRGHRPDGGAAWPSIWCGDVHVWA